MSLLFLPDTNILIHLVRRDAVGVRIQAQYDLLMTEPRPLISVVTVGEVRSLIYQFNWGKPKADQALFLLNYFNRISIDAPDILEAYAVLDAFAEKSGHSLGKNDLWIAATALVMGATLLTTDRDFDFLSPQFFPCDWIDPNEERKV